MRPEGVHIILESPREGPIAAEAAAIGNHNPRANLGEHLRRVKSFPYKVGYIASSHIRLGLEEIASGRAKTPEVGREAARRYLEEIDINQSDEAKSKIKSMAEAVRIRFKAMMKSDEHPYDN